MVSKELDNTLSEKAYINLMGLNESGEGEEKESFIYKLSSKESIRKNNFGDVCVRDFPHCESKQMYNFFKGEKLIEKELDFTEYNKTIFGEHIANFDGTTFDNFNKIKISAPESILKAFLEQKVTDKNINIMFNSIRNIPNTKSLCSIDFTKLSNITDTENAKFIEDYGVVTPKNTTTIDGSSVEIANIMKEIDGEEGKANIHEEPITQQYCNFFEFLNMLIKEDYYKKFVVIITNQNLYQAYRQLYPHFIIAVQPNVSFQCVGLTRYTGLCIANYANLNRVIFSDDNVININKIGRAHV